MPKTQSGFTSKRQVKNLYASGSPGAATKGDSKGTRARKAAIRGDLNRAEMLDKRKAMQDRAKAKRK
jgi:hypothetical protein